MTCREVFYAAHSKMEPEEAVKLFKDSCPEDFGYADDPDYCIGSDLNDLCVKCWNRECTEKIFIYDHLSEPIANVTDVKISDGGCEVIMEPIIKDSGNRREFESGAVRDMQEGKGRCDLMPLEVAADILHSPVITNIANFQKSKLTRFLFAALEQFAVERYSDDSNENETCTKVYCDMLLEVAKHFEEGAKKYGEGNWRRGIPDWCYIDSATRHYLKWRRGDRDEFHCRAFCWNLMCCIWEVDYRCKEEKA